MTVPLGPDDDRYNPHHRIDLGADAGETDSDDSWDEHDGWLPDDLDLELDDEPQPEPGDFWIDEDDDDEF
jgi:hypothetical protein